MVEALFAVHGLRFTYLSLGRFDQQVTTRFHLDGAPPASLLMLGYEPSRVASRLFLADYSRAAFDLGISPAAFLQDYNLMYCKGAEALHGYITEVNPPVAGHATILLVKNSLLPLNAAGTNPLGVMHKAEIEAPDATQQRIVNSILLTAGEASTPDDHKREVDFLASDAISPQVYLGKA